MAACPPRLDRFVAAYIEALGLVVSVYITVEATELRIAIADDPNKRKKALAKCGAGVALLWCLKTTHAEILIEACRASAAAIAAPEIVDVARVTALTRP
jgi:hypothetical protein